MKYQPNKNLSHKQKSYYQDYSIDRNRNEINNSNNYNQNYRQNHQYNHQYNNNQQYSQQYNNQQYNYNQRNLNIYPNKSYFKENSDNLWLKYTNFNIDYSNSSIHLSRDSAPLNPTQLNEFICNCNKIRKTNIVLEQKRYYSVSQLRVLYEKLLYDKLDRFKVPKESFNRWLFERMIHEREKRGNDPILPLKFEPLAPTLLTEILDDVPVKVNMFPKSKEDALKSIQIYKEKCLSWIDKENWGDILSNQQKELLIQALNDIEKYAQTESDLTLIINKFKDKKTIIQSIFKVKIDPILNDIISTLSEKSESESKKLESKFSSEPKILVKEKNGMILFEYNMDSQNQEQTSYTNNILNITKSHYNRLNALYTGDKSKFIENLYCLLRRYETLFGDTKVFEGTGHHAAIPPNVMELLHTTLGVEMECFASPLNSYFKHYCSAFVDTDVYFGSVGSFFDLEFIRGSFEANPPFENELMIKMGQKMELSIQIANQNNESLSFIIIVPYWSDSEAIQNLISSSNCRKHLILNKGHKFVSGSQHSNRKLMYNSVHDTLICCLQSIEGEKKWPCNDFNKIQEAWYE